MKKNRIIAALAAFAVCLSMTACGSVDEDNGTKKEKKETTAATTADEAEAPEETGDEAATEAAEEAPAETEAGETEAAETEAETDNTEENTAAAEEPANITRLPNAGGEMEQLENFLPKLLGQQLTIDEICRLFADEFDAGVNETPLPYEATDENGSPYSSYTLNFFSPTRGGRLNILGHRFVSATVDVYETEGVTRLGLTKEEEIEYYGDDQFEDIVDRIIDAYGDDAEYEIFTDESSGNETYVFYNLPTGNVSVSRFGGLVYLNFFIP